MRGSDRRLMIAWVEVVVWVGSEVRRVLFCVQDCPGNDRPLAKEPMVHSVLDLHEPSRCSSQAAEGKDLKRDLTVVAGIGFAFQDPVSFANV